MLGSCKDDENARKHREEILSYSISNKIRDGLGMVVVLLHWRVLLVWWLFVWWLVIWWFMLVNWWLVNRMLIDWRLVNRMLLNGFVISGQTLRNEDKSSKK